MKGVLSRLITQAARRSDVSKKCQKQGSGSAQPNLKGHSDPVRERELRALGTLVFREPELIAQLLLNKCQVTSLFDRNLIGASLRKPLQYINLVVRADLAWN